MQVNFKAYKSIVILTGAGVSVASGIRPFRGQDGLWNDPALVRLAQVETYQTDPLAVWNFWVAMREVVTNSQPNQAHLALARIESSLNPDQKLLLITQNIDGLHQRAGSQNVVELHGNVLHSRCTAKACTLKPFVDLDGKANRLGVCPLCGAALRADVVQFGEDLPALAEWTAKRALRDCDLFIAIGTSGTVAPASNFVRNADYAGARTIYINSEAMEPANPYFKETLIGKAEDILPGLSAPV
jgi:NAD-dependent deacetylase